MRTFKRWWKRNGRTWWRGLEAGLSDGGHAVDESHAEEVAGMAWHALWAALPRAARDLIQERERQVAGEGYSKAHDDHHTDGSLALAAAVYAIPDGDRSYVDVPEPEESNAELVPALWPWRPDYFKPAHRQPETATEVGGRRRELVKAGALILAELERLDRLADTGLEEES